MFTRLPVNLDVLTPASAANGCVTRNAAANVNDVISGANRDNALRVLFTEAATLQAVRRVYPAVILLSHASHPPNDASEREPENEPECENGNGEVDE